MHVAYYSLKISLGLATIKSCSYQHCLIKYLNNLTHQSTSAVVISKEIDELIKYIQ